MCVCLGGGGETGLTAYKVARDFGQRRVCTAAEDLAVTMATAGIVKSSKSAMDTYYAAKIEELEVEVRDKMLNLRRLEAQRNELNSKVRLLREELSLLQEPGSYVGEVVKVMGRKKVLVKVRPQQMG